MDSYGFTMTDADVITRYLVQGEAILAWAKQRQIAGIWPIKPNYVVLTNRRFLVIEPSLLTCSFSDIHLIDFQDIHIKEHIFGATITCTSLDGKQLISSCLNSQTAIAVYQAGQEVEENARELRRQRQMEEARAAATNITMG